MGGSCTCSVEAGAEGLTVRWEDEGHTLQSQVVLRQELFEEYKYSGEDLRTAFGLRLNLLADTLGLFSSLDPQTTLELAYPGPAGELMFEVREQAGGTSITTFANLLSSDLPPQEDWGADWVEPSSAFQAPGDLLKAAMDDLEWAGPRVELLLEPVRSVSGGSGQVKFASAGQGSLSIKVPPQAVTGFQTTQATVRHLYSLANLRAAFVDLPVGREVAGIATKVSVDARGMLKVMHIVDLQTHSTGRAGATLHGRASYFDSKWQTQSLKNAGILQFLLLPLEEDEMTE